MYQKNFKEDGDGAVPAKNSSFMDRMYMKIEALCVEADSNPSLLIQDAGKYFESHISNAGANMRKLCSELIRDLLPPPELAECKHVEKCQCRCDKNKIHKNQGGVSENGSEELGSETTPVPTPPRETSQFIQSDVHDTSNRQDSLSPPTDAPQAAINNTPSVINQDDVDTNTDTVVEAGDQSAYWFVTDDYRKSAGIMENWNGSTSVSKDGVSSTSVGVPETSSDSEWEVL